MHGHVCQGCVMVNSWLPSTSLAHCTVDNQADITIIIGLTSCLRLFRRFPWWTQLLGAVLESEEGPESQILFLMSLKMAKIAMSALYPRRLAIVQCSVNSSQDVNLDTNNHKRREDEQDGMHPLQNIQNKSFRKWAP